VSVWEVSFVQFLVATIVATIRGVLAIALSLIVIGGAKANPVEVESDAGVVSMVATVEAIDVTNQLVTVAGPTTIGSWSRSSQSISS
jgi:hypothetical protein